MPDESACIFCRKEGRLTLQHVIGQQLVKELPPSPEGSEFGRLLQLWDEGKGDFKDAAANPIPGPLNHAVRALCGPCNHDWVNKMENTAKPLLVTMGQAKRKTLSTRQQTEVASWAVMATMVAEFGDPRHRAISASDRDHMYKHHRPTEWAQVWAAISDAPPWTVGYRHLGFQVHPTQGWVPTDAPLTCQLTRISFGRLVMLVLTSSTIHIEVDQPSAVRIWPPTQPARWPLHSVMPSGNATLWANTTYAAIAEHLPGDTPVALPPYQGV